MYMRACSVTSVVSDSATPWTISRQAPLSMEFFRQEYWGGLPFSAPGYLPDPGIKLKSPTSTGRLFTAEPPRKPHSIFGACEYTILIPEPGGKSNWTKWAFILKL